MSKFIIPEILAPVGGMDSLKVAVNSDCDAVYLGGKNFGARSFAGNFDNEELKNAIEYAHLRGKKVYITLNTLYKNSELNDVLEFVNGVYTLGADALIVQDIGMGTFIKKYFPQIRLHGSTQMSIHNLEGVLYLESLGFDRVVLSRELSLLEIKNITRNTNVETEIFVHGALCFSYSGQCLASSFIGQRSGNRGKCGQMCRLNFNLKRDDLLVDDGHLLSPKDIMTLPILKEIVEANVSSLKIEGRMKKPEYVAVTTKTYRNQLNKIEAENFSVDKSDVDNLAKVFIRDGSFSSGYFKNFSTPNMMTKKTSKKTGLFIGKVENFKNGKLTFTPMSDLTAGDRIGIFTEKLPFAGSNINFDSPKGKKLTLNVKGNNINIGDIIFKSYDKKIVDDVKRIENDDSQKIEINAVIKAKLGEPLEITLSGEGIVLLEKSDEAIEKALKNPTTAEELKKRFGKTGDTTFTLDITDVDMDDNIFIRISTINELKRKALKTFEDAYLKTFINKRESLKIKVKLPSDKNKLPEKKLLVSLKTREAFNVAIEENIFGVYIDVHLLEKNADYFIEKASKKNIKLYAELPTVTRLDDTEKLSETLNALEQKNIDGYLIKNHGQFFMLKDSEKEKVLNFNFNVTNDLSYEFLKNNSDRITVSVELNLHDINDIHGENKEIVAFGKIPVMTTSQCPIGLYVGKKETEKFCNQRFVKQDYSLVDDKGFSFPIKQNCHECYAEILNSSTLYMKDKISDLYDSNVEFLRLIFTDETDDAVKNIIKIYNNEINQYIVEDKNITYGHFYRGML